jgi:hypothetical protein
MMDVSNPGGNIDNKVLSPILRGRIGGLVRRLPPRGERREAVVFNAGRIPERHRSFGCWEAAERPGVPFDLAPMMDLSNPGGMLIIKSLVRSAEAVLAAWYAGFPQGGTEALVFPAAFPPGGLKFH